MTKILQIRLWAALAVLMIAPLSRAGEFNKVLDIGKSAPTFKDLPGADGKNHSLDEWKEKKAVVVAFTSNSCPFAVGYEDRLIRFAEKYKDTVAVVAIGVNKVPEDNLEAMKKKAEKKKFPFAYLHDETQQLAKDYGAHYTPEFFLLDADRKVAYMGAFDDKNTEKDAKVGHLENATDALLKGGKIETGETLARGCMIRFVRKRE